MRTFIPKTKDPVLLIGLAIIIISLTIFAAPLLFTPSMVSGRDGMFMLNYLATAAYLVILIVSGRLRQGRNGLHPLMFFLVLFLISAYALNRNIGIFERSSTWFCVALVGICVNYLSFSIFAHLPNWLRMVLCIVAGFSFLVFVYLSVYLIPIYAISAALGIGLGISLHAFVPILFCIYTIVLIRRIGREKKIYKTAFISGIVMPLIFVVGYIINWNSNLRPINEGFRYGSITENDRLPSWIRTAQRMKKNSTSEKILKTDLVYAVPGKWEQDFFWRMPSLNFEQKVHDPLVMISSFICGPVYLPEEKRIKILETLYDSRHQAQERLWSGENIVTERVATNIQLWPKLRLSYSEMNLTITHVPDKTSRTNGQEAIYTFHVPEGGVVTSLSLWIEGREQKGILTSKEKADSAYKTIVGVENRDPSVVHWQEGNTVTVRVFPVLEGESRKFKIGITAPMREEHDRLHYDNIWFDGPSFHAAAEDISIHIKDPVSALAIPDEFTAANDQIGHAGGYSSIWSVAFAAPPLSQEAFSFDNHSYQFIPLKKTVINWDPSAIYLDINSSWSAETCEHIYKLVRSKKVYVSQGEESLAEVQENNKDRLFKELRKNQFSLFPFSKIPDAGSSLVITHSGPLSPTIRDLRGSDFLKESYGYFANKQTVKVFELGDELSPYLKSLKEFRALNYDHGTESDLQELLSGKTFPVVIETESAVAVESAGLVIKKTDGIVPGKAPDHLMRLFAYNHILSTTGTHLMSDSPADTAAVEEAQQAYVVSPFSSLVVLESQKDYDRFDIASSRNSLENATLKSKGAVPEPGEWALIIVVVILCAVAKFYSKFPFIPAK
jgi:XrtN system VIT domain protein